MGLKVKHSIYADHTKLQTIKKFYREFQQKEASSQNNLENAYVCKATKLHDTDQVNDLNMKFQRNRHSFKLNSINEANERENQVMIEAKTSPCRENL